MKLIPWFVLVATVLGRALSAQDIGGTWQGAITLGGQSFRQVLSISKADTTWTATYYDLDEAPHAVPAASVTFEKRNLKVIIPSRPFVPGGATYEGKLVDGGSLAGTWIQAGGRWPLNLKRVTAKETWARPTPHAVRFIPVETNVKLEVLDWGGSGRPLVFLSGLGGTAHAFDWLAPKFTPTYHVYGVTRRGYGESSSPPFTSVNYSADRLGDDVLAVIDSLRLSHPVLVGHSIAGEELSSIGSRYPSKVAGLVYLDAGYAYALYDRLHGDFELDRLDLIRTLQHLQPERLPLADFRTQLHALRDSTLRRFEGDVDRQLVGLDAMPARTAADQPTDTVPSAAAAIIDGEETYTSIPVPILAIYAMPHRAQPMPGVDSATRVRLQAHYDSVTAAQATAFENGVPSAHVVRIPNSTHFVFQSNEADVLREMNAFLARLPQ